MRQETRLTALRGNEIDAGYSAASGHSDRARGGDVAAVGDQQIWPKASAMGSSATVTPKSLTFRSPPPRGDITYTRPARSFDR